MKKTVNSETEAQFDALLSFVLTLLHLPPLILPPVHVSYKNGSAEGCSFVWRNFDGRAGNSKNMGEGIVIYQKQFCVDPMADPSRQLIETVPFLKL
jgi:hypothetical protein